jgi:hypothetical protein
MGASMTTEVYKMPSTGWRTKDGRKIVARFEQIKHNGEYLHGVGLLEDGSVHQSASKKQPDEFVREAVAAAMEIVKQRRSDAAKKAGKTRRERVARLVYEVADRVYRGENAIYGPASFCHICGKGVIDPASIERGIGPDCWQHVLEFVKKRHEQAGVGTAAE